MARASQIRPALVHLFQREIWKTQHLNNRSPRGRWYALLRVVSITLTGLNETRAASRAASLSFSSLLGLGPLVAIAMLVAGFMLDKEEPNLAVNTLNRLIKFVAPQIAQYEAIHLSDLTPTPPRRSDVLTATTLNTPAQETTAAGEDPPVEATTVAVNPELVELIEGFVDGTRNGTVGAIGAIVLIVIVLQLFTSIETAFNEIWGVRRGRSWLMRLVFYWTVLTLGAVLFFAAVTGLSAGAFFNAFAERMPWGTEVMGLLSHLLPAGSLVVLVAVLTVFYRTIPNTRVLWQAALIGAGVVALLLVLNNYLAFLYVRRVILNTSLYGSLGILPIMMFGLYVFWFFVLLGGQVSYAVQNVNYRNSQAAWNSLSESMRERLSLVVLLTISRRFHDCLPPCTVSELGDMLKVPSQVLNECINRLVMMQLITPVPPAEAAAATDLRYQPARPLNRITLGEFKTLGNDYGEDSPGPSLIHLDPIMERYHQEFSTVMGEPFFKKSLEILLDEHPVKGSHPGSAANAPRSK